MFAKMPRWLVYGLILVFIASSLLIFRAERSPFPESCRQGNEAMVDEDYETAIDHLLLCLDESLSEPDFADQNLAVIYYMLGNAYFAKGDRYQAIEDYSEAIRLHPEHAWAYNNRCWTHGLLRNTEAALPDCNDALRMLPNEPGILDSRAFIYWQLGDYDRARIDLNRARQGDASFPPPDDRFREYEELL